MVVELEVVAGDSRIFTGLLTDEQRNELLSKGIRIRVKAGDCICEQHSTGDEIFVVLEGEVEVRENLQNTVIPIGKLGTGELFGEIAAIFSVPRIATVVATTESEILVVDAGSFNQTLDKLPEIKHSVYVNLYERTLDTALQCMHVDDDIAVEELSRVLSCWEADDKNEVNVHKDGFNLVKLA